MRSEGKAPKYEKQELVSPSRHCCRTRGGLFKDILAKSNVTTLEHPPYSPDLVPSDFSLNEICIDGTALLDTNDIIMIVTEQLKRLSQNIYQECFQQIYSRCQKRLFAQGDYFVGNAA